MPAQSHSMPIPQVSTLLLATLSLPLFTPSIAVGFANLPALDCAVGKYLGKSSSREVFLNHDGLELVSTSFPIRFEPVSGHLCMADRHAPEMVGVTNEAIPLAGAILKDPATAEPSGVFEQCGGLVASHVPEFCPDQRLEVNPWCEQHNLSKGVTSPAITHGNEESIKDCRCRNALCQMAREAQSSPASWPTLLCSPRIPARLKWCESRISHA